VNEQQRIADLEHENARLKDKVRTLTDQAERANRSCRESWEYLRLLKGANVRRID
jgi:hypothetical protein